MRKPLVLIMIVFFCFSMFQFMHIATSSSQSRAITQAVSDSVIQNGGFEQGLTGWTSAGSGLLALSADNPHTGNYSLEISSSISQQAYFYQFINMPNTSFVYSFWVFRVDENSWTACYLGRDWDGNTMRPVSSLIIQDDIIQLNAWDNPYAPGRQVFNYDVSVGVWHNMTFAANAVLGTQDFYIDGNLIENLKSSSGSVFNPDVLIFGDVSTDACNGTFYFDDIELNALSTANTNTSISITTESQSSVVGFAVNISGTLTDMQGVALKGENVVLYYAVSGVDFWSPIASDSTDDLGNYYAQWIPAGTGYFVVKAVFTGNSTYAGTSSNITLSILPYGTDYVFGVESNSTVSDLNFDAQNTTLSFEVSGAEGTTGYVRVTLAKTLAPDISKLTVQLDSSNYSYTYQETDVSWIVTFTYTHSVHQVYINLGQKTVDEFSPYAFWIMLLATGALLVFVGKKRTIKGKHELNSISVSNHDSL